MKPGLRHCRNASCFVSISKALPVDMRLKTREISNLDVPENLRGQGMGFELLREVTEEADRFNMTLILFPKPFGNEPRMTQEQLESWYERRFGFITIQKSPMMMARMPHSTPRFLNPVSATISHWKDIK